MKSFIRIFAATLAVLVLVGLILGSGIATSTLARVLVYGEMHQNDNAIAVGISVQDQWEEIGNFSEGLTNSVTYSANTLVIPSSGRYQLIWGVSSSSGGTGKTYEIAFSVDDVIAGKSRIGRKYSTSDLGASAGPVLLDLNAGDVIKLEARCTDAVTADLTIMHANVQIHKL